MSGGAMPQNDKKDGPEFFLRARQIGILTSVPFVLLLGPLIGYFLGHWIDQKMGWEPVGTVLMVTLGFFASARETVRLVKQVIQNQ